MNINRHINGYIFDYGGTLDTGGHHWGKVLWHVYEHLHVPVSEEQFREAYVYGERTLARQPIIRPDFTFRQTLEAKINLQLEHLRQHASVGDALSSPVAERLVEATYAQTQAHTAHSREVLLRLKARYPMVLVSNFYGNVGVVLREFGLDDIFQSIVESAVVGVRKPDPRIFTLGVEVLRMRPEEVVVVGDSIDKDIIPAKRAGCRTVWYEGEQWTDDPVDRSIPDTIITDLTELI